MQNQVCLLSQKPAPCRHLQKPHEVAYLGNPGPRRIQRTQKGLESWISPGALWFFRGQPIAASLSRRGTWTGEWLVLFARKEVKVPENHGFKDDSRHKWKDTQGQVVDWQDLCIGCQVVVGCDVGQPFCLSPAALICNAWKGHLQAVKNYSSPESAWLLVLNRKKGPTNPRKSIHT